MLGPALCTGQSPASLSATTDADAAHAARLLLLTATAETAAPLAGASSAPVEEGAEEGAEEKVADGCGDAGSIGMTAQLRGLTLAPPPSPGHDVPRVPRAPQAAAGGTPLGGEAPKGKQRELSLAAWCESLGGVTIGE